MIRKITDCAAIEYGTTDRLLVLFSSKPAMRRDVFDYVTFVQNMPHNKLFLRDAQSDYLYHTGISGLTDTIEETVDFLRFFIKRMKPARTTFMGMSGGGYAAGLFGHLVGADPETRIDDIHVQSSVTFANPKTRDRLGGGERFPGNFQGLVDFLASRGDDARYTDLNPIVAAHPDSVRLMRMYYAQGDMIDTLHAQNLAMFKHVQTAAHPSNSHMMLGATLMREGTLYRDLDTPMETLMTETPTATPVPEAAPAGLGMMPQRQPA